LLTKKSKTVIFLLKEFNKKNIPYCIARNYENFPNFKSDLDIFYINKLNLIKKIFINTAKKFHWDYLIYDENKSKNFLDQNKIEIFYFYDRKKENFLQIDFFRSMLVFGVPYFKFKNENIEKIKKKFNILPRIISKTYHVFQIASLLPINTNNKKKIIKYKTRFLSLKIKNTYKKNVFFENFLLIKIQKTLKLNKLKFFNALIFIYKLQIFLKYYLKNPLKIYEFFFRIYEYYLLFFKQKSGFKISIINKKHIIKNAEETLNRFKKLKIIDNWNYKSKINLLNRFKFLERRNVLLNIDDKTSKTKNFKKIFINILIKQNKLLYKKKIL
tara:strand:- start:297 stop:1280 length:984 start_codon:yes stop_codon:yes gene_type:complete